MGGDEVCFVTMTGAKSGNPVTIPLLYLPYRNGVLLVASQTGRPTNPIWYKNLMKHPEIEVRHRGDTLRLRAREAGAEEKPGLWPQQQVWKPARYDKVNAAYDNVEVFYGNDALTTVPVDTVQ